MVKIECDFCAAQKDATSPTSGRMPWLTLSEDIDPWDSQAGEVYPHRKMFCSPRCLVLWTAGRWQERFGESLTLPNGDTCIVVPNTSPSLDHEYELGDQIDYGPRTPCSRCGRRDVEHPSVVP